MKEGVSSVVISYNPDYKIVDNVSSLAEQVNLVVVVDNGSSEISKIHLNLLEELKNIKIIYNLENLGIAAALNIGVKYLMQAGYLWIATFDQDTTLTPGCIASMLKAYEVCDFKEEVVLIAPTYFFPCTGEYSKAKKCQHESLHFALIQTAITSGSLIKSAVFKDVGFFQEDLFIDYVDFEFCFRCKKRGYKLIQSCKSVIHHTIGEPTRKSFLWMKPIISNHSYLRVYYSSRNRVVIYKSYFLSNTFWMVEDFMRFIKVTIKMAIFEEDSARKLYYTLIGVLHGFIGKMGRYK